MDDDPAQWQPILNGNQLTRELCHPYKFERGKEHNFQENIMKWRRIQYNIFNYFKNQSDTYHDTRNHYLMEKYLHLLQEQASGMDIVVVDKWIALKKRGALWGHAQVVRLSVLHF